MHMVDLPRKLSFTCPVACLFIAIFACVSNVTAGSIGEVSPATRSRPPNILLILADDLGWGELGCYGQKRIRTPNLDALAAGGARFTQAYSGSPVCAPSRCTILTGLHTGHCAIRDNRELSPEGQEPLPASAVTIGSRLRDSGYSTAFIGKWGLGPPGSVGDPSKHGFDLFYGYLCQRHAHGYYPTSLYRNTDRVPLKGNKPKYSRGDEHGQIYAPDAMLSEAKSFLRASTDRPFFLMYATPVPHLALQVPEDSLAEYRGKLGDDPPYEGGNGYLPHAAPRAAYAAMVTRMDRDLGEILDLLREQGRDRDTIVIFTSDNGPSWIGGTDSVFFNSAGGLRGRKAQVFEGGIRVPLIIRWPGRIAAGSTHDAPVASWDLFPTIIEAAGLAPTPGLDGLSLLPALTSTSRLPTGRSLYWEYPSDGGWQAVRVGNYKGLRRGLKKNPDAPIELFDLAADPGETKDLAADHPEIVGAMRRVIDARTPAMLPAWNYD